MEKGVRGARGRGEAGVVSEACTRVLLLLWVAVLLRIEGVVADLESTEAFSIGLCGSLVQPWGYPCTEHTVETEDGYLLGLQNIPSGVTKLDSVGGAVRRPPVFLQHGLFAGGDNWLFNGASESLGFILADAGFDVWIGNSRSVVWSHGHVNLTTVDEEFWQWSWDELAAYDLPALLSFVYSQTDSQIMYVGHSQGTSTFMAGLVGTAQSEAMASKLAGAVLLCPIVYLDHIDSAFDLAAAGLYADKVLTAFGVHEFDLDNELGVELIGAVCETAGVNCTDLFRAATGNECCVNNSRVPFYLNFYPQPTSSNNMAHFAQMILSNSFSKYDYGYSGNMQVYKQANPPEYMVSNFPATVPLMIIHGGEDAVANPRNTQHLLDVVGSRAKRVEFLPNYAHVDFVASSTANVDIYPQIINFLRDPMATS